MHATRSPHRFVMGRLTASISVFLGTATSFAQEEEPPAPHEVEARLAGVLDGSLTLDRGDVPDGFNPYFECAALDDGDWSPVDGHGFAPLTLTSWTGDPARRDQGEVAFETLQSLGAWVGTPRRARVRVESSRTVWPGMVEVGVSFAVDGDGRRITGDASIRVLGKIFNAVRPTQLRRAIWGEGRFIEETARISSREALRRGEQTLALARDPRVRPATWPGALGVLPGRGGDALMIGRPDGGWLARRDAEGGWTTTPSRMDTGGGRTAVLQAGGDPVWITWGRGVSVSALEDGVIGEAEVRPPGSDAVGLGQWTSLVVTDVDGDGLSDLLAGAHPTMPGSRARMPWPLRDARNGAANRAWRNLGRVDGAWAFEEATEAFGWNLGNDRWTAALALTGDGDRRRLWVANEYGPLQTYAFEDGRLRELWTPGATRRSHVRWLSEWCDEVGTTWWGGHAGGGLQRLAVQDARDHLAPRVFDDLFGAAMSVAPIGGSRDRALTGGCDARASVWLDTRERRGLGVVAFGCRATEEWSQAIRGVAAEGVSEAAARRAWAAIPSTTGGCEPAQALVSMHKQGVPFDVAPFIGLDDLGDVLALVAGDFDGDGDDDLAALGRTDPALRVWCNDVAAQAPERQSLGPGALTQRSSESPWLTCLPKLPAPPMAGFSTEAGLWGMTSDSDEESLKRWAADRFLAWHRVLPTDETATRAFSSLMSWAWPGWQGPSAGGLLLVREGSIAAINGTSVRMDVPELPAPTVGLESAPLGAGFDRVLRSLREAGDAALVVAWVAGRIDLDDASRLEVGRAALESDQAAEAIPRLERIGRRSPHFADAQLELARAHLRFRNGREAEKCFEEALRLRPFDAQTCVEFGRLLLGKGDSVRAEALLHRAFYLGRDDYPFHLAFARALTAAGWLRHALEIGARARDQKPDAAEPWRILGEAHLRLEAYDDATAAFSIALERTEGVAADQLRWWLARAALDGGDATAARTWLEAMEQPDAPAMRSAVEAMRTELSGQGS